MLTRFHKKFCLVFFILSLILSFLYLASNLRGVVYNCFNAYDLGIFHQAFTELANQKIFNPYLTVRNIHFFNDHFKLISFLPALIYPLFSYSVYTAVVTEWIFFFGALLLLMYLLRKKKREVLFLAIILFVFCKATITAMMFPVHPGTWALPVLVLLSYGIVQGNTLLTLSMNALMPLFRETYVLGAIFLNMFMIFRRQRFALRFLILPLSFFLFVFVFRSYFLGPVFDYTSRFLIPFKADPLAYFLNWLKTFPWDAYWKNFIILLLPAFFYFKYEENKGRFFSIFFFVLPCFLLNVLYQKWSHHYMLISVVPFLCFFIFTSSFEKLATSRFAYLAILVAVLTSSNSLKKMFIPLHPELHKPVVCRIDAQKKDETKQVVKIVREFPLNEKVFSTPQIVPLLIRPGSLIYPTQADIAIQDDFSYALLEKELFNEEEWGRVAPVCRKGKILFEGRDYLLSSKEDFVPCAREVKKILNLRNI